MSSTRTEMAGIFAAITHLRLVVEYYAITPTKSTSCRIYWDCKGALARVGDKRHDSFGTIRTYLLQLPIPISWHWVKGHASARKHPDELTFPEILTETADELATKACRSKNLTHTDNDHWPEQMVSIIGPRGRAAMWRRNRDTAARLRICFPIGKTGFTGWNLRWLWWIFLEHRRLW
jgi:hypothetical protein